MEKFFQNVFLRKFNFKYFLYSHFLTKTWLFRNHASKTKFWRTLTPLFKEALRGKEVSFWYVTRTSLPNNSRRVLFFISVSFGWAEYNAQKLTFQDSDEHFPPDDLSGFHVIEEKVTWVTLSQPNETTVLLVNYSGRVMGTHCGVSIKLQAEQENEIRIQNRM